MSGELKVILGIVAGLALGYGIGLYARRDCKPDNGPEIQIDTIYRTDTITKLQPVERAKYIRDTMLVAVADTVTIRDTAYIQLPREVKVYEDSLYRAVVSGYKPQLDTMSIYCHQTTIIKHIPYKVKPRWGVGVQAGYGIGRDGIGPYIGVGVQYNLFGW